MPMKITNQLYRFVLVCAIIVGISITATSQAAAQDFTQLLQAVDNIEVNLKAMIKQEASKRTEAINALKEEIKTPNNSTNSDVKLIAQVESLQSEVLSLRQEIQLYQKAQSTSFVSEQDLVEILSDVEYLKAENAYMRSLADKNEKLLVSLDGTGTNEIIADNQVKSLENKLEVLNHQISSLQESQFEGGESANLGGIEMSGFMDFISSYTNSVQDETNIGLGQAEIDLAKDLGMSKSVEVAIAYNGDEGKFELGAAFLDIHLSKSVEERHIRKASSIHSSLRVGQFDVPFGIDYQSYASVDRKLISAPRVVDLTHEGWNDIGFNLVMENGYGNLSLFVVNGFESSAEVSTGVINIATGLPDVEEVDTTPSNAFGGRVGINLLSGLEVGSSVALGLNADNKDEMLLFGADLQYNISNLFIKGEYIQHSINRSIQKENNKGYYIQSLYDFNSFFVTSRYGSFQPDGIEWVGQLSLGGGVPLSDGIEIRVESIIHESSANNTTMLQFVSEF